jgi:AcrR family transcriptional regulator
MADRNTLLENAGPRPRRRRNPEQTRRAIVEATLAALSEGTFLPTTKDISARSGASERIIFVHFPGRDDLRLAVVEEQATRVEALIEEVDPALPLNERIDAVVRRSEAIYDLQRFPRLTGLIEAHSMAGVDARMRLTETRTRESLARAFGTELTRDGALDEQLLDLVDTALGWSAYHYYIERRQLSRADSSKAVRRAVAALLSAA